MRRLHISQKAIIRFTIPRQVHSSLTLRTANPALMVYLPLPMANPWSPTSSTQVHTLPSLTTRSYIHTRLHRLALGHLSPQVGPLFLPNLSLHLLPQRPYDNSQIYCNRLQLTLRMLPRKQATLRLLLVVQGVLLPLLVPLAKNVQKQRRVVSLRQRGLRQVGHLVTRGARTLLLLSNLPLRSRRTSSADVSVSSYSTSEFCFLIHVMFHLSSDFIVLEFVELRVFVRRFPYSFVFCQCLISISCFVHVLLFGHLGEHIDCQG